MVQGVKVTGLGYYYRISVNLGNISKFIDEVLKFRDVFVELGRYLYAPDVIGRKVQGRCVKSVVTV